MRRAKPRQWGPVRFLLIKEATECRDLLVFTAVRLKLEQNQLVGVSGEIGILVDALKGA